MDKEKVLVKCKYHKDYEHYSCTRVKGIQIECDILLRERGCHIIKGCGVIEVDWIAYINNIQHITVLEEGEINDSSKGKI